MKTLPLAVLLVLAGTPATAAITVYIYENGPDVIVQGSGSIDTRSLTATGTVGTMAVVLPNVAIHIGSTRADPRDRYSVSLSGPATIGPGISYSIATVSTGDFFGFHRFSSSDEFYLRTGYVSGDPLAATATYANTSIAGMGLTWGDYTWTWGSGETADSWTVHVGTVPEPAHCALLAALAAAACVWRRIQR